MLDPIVLTNSWVVTRDRAFIGTIELAGEHIVAVYRGPTTLPGAVDLDGDYLLPGLVDAFSSNLAEMLTAPPPALRGSVLHAILAHDVDMICAGITTVCDVVRTPADGETAEVSVPDLAAALYAARDRGLVRADHRLFLDCDGSRGTCVGRFVARPEEGAANSSGRPATATLGAVAGLGGPVAAGTASLGTAVVRASPDPRLCGSAADSPHNHIRLPCTLPLHFSETEQAARTARRSGLAVAAFSGTMAGPSGTWPIGMPDVLARSGLLDVMSSDRQPRSLLRSAFALHQGPVRLPLASAVATVSATPAALCGLIDRGELAPGKRADLIRVRVEDEAPYVREVWLAGRRVL